MKIIVSTLLASILLLGGTPASATLFTFSTTLLGANETPPNTSPATGSAKVILNDVTEAIDVSVNFTGLVAPSAVAHVHNAPPGVPGPIILPLADFPAGVTSGNYTHSFTAADLTDGITTFAQFLAAALAGDTYVNVHSQEFPEGEIRGQLAPVQAVPEPTALAILGLGLAGLGFARRRR